MTQSPLTIYNLFNALLSPMPADKTAMGSIPASALQYCEALTTASSFGHYVFPPRDLEVVWRGSEFEYRTAGAAWQRLDTVSVGDDAISEWQNQAPEGFQNRLPAFVQRFFVPDTIQVWSGMFVSSAPGWSALVRPIANVIPDRNTLLYEGVVETDIFSPCPLFVNIRFLSKDTVFRFEKFRPLFQVQPIQRESYRNGVVSVADASDFNWDGLLETTRIFSSEDTDLSLGSYKKKVRSRKRET